MRGKTLAGALCAGLIAMTGLVTGVHHAGAQGDVIKERQAAMKAVSDQSRQFAAILKGEMAYAPERVRESADIAVANLEKAQGLFPEGSDQGDTRAKPEIWQNKAEFDGLLAKALDGARAVQASTDEASFKTAFAAYGRTCSACHQPYRAPAN